MVGVMVLVVIEGCIVSVTGEFINQDEQKLLSETGVVC